MFARNTKDLITFMIINIYLMLKHIINLLFPKVCAGCKSILLSEEICICTNCRHEIPLTNHHLKAKNEIHQLFYGKIALEFAASLFYFQKHGLVQELIFSLKYRGNQEIGTVLGHWLGENIKNLPIVDSFDYIIPVPLHSQKLRKRGYNQVTTFGKALSEVLEKPFEENILKRVTYSKSQTQKSFLKRTQIDKTAFDVSFIDAHHNKHFLLIDDVLTTGSTIEACAIALQKIPGVKISLVTISITNSF